MPLLIYHSVLIIIWLSLQIRVSSGTHPVRIEIVIGFVDFMALLMYNVMMKKDKLEQVMWSNLAVESADLNINNADVAGLKKVRI